MVAAIATGDLTKDTTTDEERMGVVTITVTVIEINIGGSSY
jgi:hypothetical protein